MRVTELTEFLRSVHVYRLVLKTAIFSDVTLLMVGAYILLAILQSALPLFSQIPTIRHPN